MNTATRALSPSAAAAQRAGCLLFLGALVAFATFDAGSKYMITRYPPTFLNLMRYTSVALVGAFWLLRVWRGRDRGAPDTDAQARPVPTRLLVTRGLLLCTVGTCYMTALIWMPLSEATAIYFTSPLIMVALSPWLLRERVRVLQWLAVGVGFGGMLLIVRPGGELPWIGTALMVAAAIAYALFQLVTRRLAAQTPGYVQFGYATAICWIGAALPAPFFPPAATPGAGELLALLVLGMCSGIAQVLLIAAFQRVAASTLAPLNYLQLPMAVAYSTFLFDRPPDLVAAAGIALICGAGLFLALSRRPRT
ncbi:DMT family transporter [Achromobacter aloeverae]|uniref:EamA family transporter n=1 Tax=Achromobacter aloeverae TaxID=1750518 RepID=A0A4Q1HLY1_9BURK|nr:DMT family transporter [Achromobacter aloeverae]RXN90942.1 EamA family transporter [Achromobacter aloeverae]